MIKPLITILIVNDAQKREGLLSYCLAALAGMNAEALPAVEIVILDQHEMTDGSRRIAEKAALPIPVRIQRSRDLGDRVAGDHCLWNVMECLRLLRPTFRGDYLLYLHKEFILGADYLHTAINVLRRQHWPDLLLGNLTRLGVRNDLGRFRQHSSDRETSEKLCSMFDAGCDKEAIREAMSAMPQMDWSMCRRVEGEWREDVFFARMEWLDAVNLFGLCDRQVFQDLFDLIGVVCRRLPRGLRPIIGQMDALGPRIYHLWHDKSYTHFTDAVLEWFVSDAETWEGTRYTDAALWRTIQQFLRNRSEFSENPIIEFRRGPRGSVWRFERALKQWLAANGGLSLENYRRGNYQQNGHAGLAGSLLPGTVVVPPGSDQPDPSDAGRPGAGDRALSAAGGAGVRHDGPVGSQLPGDDSSRRPGDAVAHRFEGLRPGDRPAGLGAPERPSAGGLCRGDAGVAAGDPQRSLSMDDGQVSVPREHHPADPRRVDAGNRPVADGANAVGGWSGADRLSVGFRSPVRAAVLCPGDSLAGYPGREGYDIVIAVNRAVNVVCADYWVMLDAHTFGISEPMGRPTIVTARHTYRQACRQWPAAAAHPHHEHRGIGVPSNAVRWRKFSLTVALVLAHDLGASQIDVYGADWRGQSDFDGRQFKGQVRTEARWKAEKALFHGTVRLLESRGTQVRRIAATCCDAQDDITREVMSA